MMTVIELSYQIVQLCDEHKRLFDHVKDVSKAYKFQVFFGTTSADHRVYSLEDHSAQKMVKNAVLQMLQAQIEDNSEKLRELGVDPKCMEES